MTRNYPTYLESPKSFCLRLLGLWAFIAISLGFFSHWIFSNLPGGSFLGESIVFSTIYTTFFLSLFGTTWWWLHKRFPLSKTKNLIVHGGAQVLNSLAGFVIGTIINGFLHRYLSGDPDGSIMKVETEIAVSALLCIVGILFVNSFFYSRAFLKRSLDAEKRNAESELRALRAQINPHFLFNSLNSIAALIRISPGEAESVTEDLADLFRHTLRAGDRPLSTIGDEMEIAELYLNIEKARFKDRLKVTFDIPAELKKYEVPILTIQPLVENAIKHGVSKKEGSHEIHLGIKQENGMLEIQCRDTGPGFREKDFSKLLDRGTGLTNVFQRLKIHFGPTVDGAITDNELHLKFPSHQRKGGEG